MVVLERKLTLYQEVVDSLRKEMGGVEFNGIRRRLQAVVDRNLSRTLDLK